MTPVTVVKPVPKNGDIVWIGRRPVVVTVEGSGRPGEVIMCRSLTWRERWRLFRGRSSLVAVSAGKKGRTRAEDRIPPCHLRRWEIRKELAGEQIRKGCRGECPLHLSLADN